MRVVRMEDIDDASQFYSALVADHCELLAEQATAVAWINQSELMQSSQKNHPGKGLGRFLAAMAKWMFIVFCHAVFAVEAEERGNSQRFDVYQPHPSGIEIQNGKSGVVCLEDDEPSYICAEAYTIKITGEVMCEWSEDIDYPCTWYGYQFDISNVEADTLIICDVTNSIRTTFGPKTDKVTGNNTAQYTIKLEAGQDHVFHPAYHTYAPVERETDVISIHACSVDDMPLYRVSFRAFYEPEDETVQP
jgi:hypothetical protein